MSDAADRRSSPWPHRMAWVLCCATFPLLWIGGLITTTDAGMAVPDWPGTYGYNLFLYPWRTWMFGPWDLLVEHGHRLFASGVGLLTIAFVTVVWRSGAGRRLRWLSVLALALVIWQGVLGGLRVVLNERLLAMLHGSTGPLFFALTAILVVLTGRQATASSCDPAPRSSRWLWLLPLLVYAQLTLGASMRHVPEDGKFTTFSTHAVAHAWGAVIVTLALLANAALAWRETGGRRLLATLMVLVVGVQASLGVATWVAKYRLPEWAQRGAAADAWATVAGAGTMSPSTAGGWTETHVVTGHSATGSLLLALSAAHAVVRRRPASPTTPRSDEATP